MPTKPISQLEHLELGNTSLNSQARKILFARNEMQEAAKQARRLAVKTASSGFIPPSWSDLAPLLKGSVLLWLAILVIGTSRSALYKYFHSDSFRTIVKKAKRGGRTRGPLIRFAKLFRNARMLLVRNRFPETTTAFWFGLPRFTAGVVVCVLYIIDTYMKGIPTHFYIFQCVYGIAISVNLIVSFIYAERPVLFAFSLKTIIECLSIPSLLFSHGARWLNFNFLQAYCILVEWEVLEKHDIVMRNNSTLARLLINLFLQLLTFLFITSCGVQFFELLGDPIQVLRSETFQITWANSVYFAVVTLMTVGYGDFVPYTFLGRMWIVFHIIFAAYLVSRDISLLIDALKSMRRGGGSYISSSGTGHIIVTGRVKWEFLQQFVKEFLAEPSNLDTRVIVLSSHPNWSDDDWHKFVSHNPFFDHHLMFLEGSALSTDDLTRAHVAAARGVFVLADPHRQDPYKEDSDILKTVLTIRDYSGTIPIYTFNTLADSSFQFGIALEHIEPSFQSDLVTRAALRPSPTFLGIPLTPTVAHPGELIDRDFFHNESHYHAAAAAASLAAPDIDISQPAVISDTIGAGAQSDYSLDNASTDPGDNFDESAQYPAMPGDSVRDTTAPHSRRPKELAIMRKSESLCMQELETILLAENTFCNGLSTLIANATLRVAPQSHRNDRPWLTEYKLGAECSIQQFVIRPDMHEVPFGKVASILQDYGLVPLAIRKKMDSGWTLLTTETILEKNMSAMALSYHDHSVIDRIADIAAQTIREDNALQLLRSGDGWDAPAPGTAGPAHQQDPMNLSMHSSQSQLVSDGETPSEERIRIHETRYVPVANNEEGALAESAGDAGRWSETYISTEAPFNPDQGLNQPKTLAKSSITRSMSTSTARILKKTESKIGEEDTEKLGRDATAKSNIGEVRGSRSGSIVRKSRSKRSGKHIYTGVDKLPAALRGHVIICLDGEGPLINLEVLLRRIWMRRAGQKKRAPVVVIHPRFPSNYHRRLGGDQNGLFLLQGNSLSLDTLRQAQYQSARAVLIMASESDEAVGHGSTDSRAIFTVMTLDALLADQETFVCCILDAEQSLELLRAPRHARRVGVNLGEHREPDVFNYERSPMAGIPKRTASSTSFARSLPTSPYVAGYGGYSPYGTFASAMGTYSHGSRSSVGRDKKASRLLVKGMTRSSSMRIDTGDSSEDDEVNNLRDLQNSQQRSREELYERQRYASGEMVISSLFTALLARDYSDPGYIRLIRQLIGASSGSSGSWIRQVEIPEAWTRMKNAIDGRTYRETSVQLLKLGCVALGLYRSGDAPVRVETQSEHWERRVDEVVYLGEEEISMVRSDAESRSVASRIINSDVYSNRRHGRVGVGPWGQEAGGNEVPSLSSNRMSVPDRLFSHGEENLDAFDQMYYTCPTTKRRIFYREAENGENVLPYVYSCPEPYSLVASSDAVFVLCHPRTVIPPNWAEM